MSLERKLSCILSAQDPKEITDYINRLDKAMDSILAKKYYIYDINAKILHFAPGALGIQSHNISDEVTVDDITKGLESSKSNSHYPETCNYYKSILLTKDAGSQDAITVIRSVVVSNRDKHEPSLGQGGLFFDDCVEVRGNGEYAREVFRVIESLYHSALEKPLSANPKVAEKPKIKFLAPKDLHAKLDEYVIGQNSAKKGLAVAISNHYAKVLNNSAFEKNNIMLIGPTGCGKTLLAKTIAKIVEVPFVIAEAPEYTSEGYVGKKVDEIFYELVKAANFDFEKAEHGIVYVDEIDKVRENFGHGPDVNGGGVQDAFLRKMEESEIELPIGKANMKEIHQGRAVQKTKKFKTDNVLFIFGGAFTGLDKLKSAYKKSNVSIGFNNPTDKKKKSVLPDLLHQYGMKREFLGRIPTILALDKLSTEELTDILYKPKNAPLGQYQEMCKNQGLELEVTEEGLRRIAEEADKFDLGARSLKTVLDILVNPIIYEFSGSQQKVTLDKEAVEKYIGAH